MGSNDCFRFNYLRKSKSYLFGITKIIEVADKGSVITNDHCVNILIKLCAVNEFSDADFFFAD